MTQNPPASAKPETRREQLQSTLDTLAMLASYVRCGKKWDDVAQVAYDEARAIINGHKCSGRPTLAYKAVDPGEPCTWPTGSCRFAKS